MPQVSKEEGYNFEKYGGVSRFGSYAYQIREILRTSPSDVLEIGVGDAVVGNYIKRQASIRYVWADIAQDLQVSIAKITRGSNELKRMSSQLITFLKENI